MTFWKTTLFCLSSDNYQNYIIRIPRTKAMCFPRFFAQLISGNGQHKICFIHHAHITPSNGQSSAKRRSFSTLFSPQLPTHQLDASPLQVLLSSLIKPVLLTSYSFLPHLSFLPTHLSSLALKTHPPPSDRLLQ